MDELLKKLTESEVLNEETKDAIKEAFDAKIKEIKEAAETEVRVQLTEQFEDEKAKLVEALDTKTEEFLSEEMKELKEDIENFRDLEAEYAERLIEEKEQMAKTLQSDMEELIDNLDKFVTECLEEEFTEFENDIEEVKKLNFGKEIFESIASHYEKNFLNEDATALKLKEAEEKLAATEQKLTEATKTLSVTTRTQKMNEVLSDLSGRPREVMEAILKSFPTEKLDEAYNKYIPRVLHESAVDDDSSEKEDAKKSTVLAESKGHEGAQDDNNTVVKTGDGEKLNENENIDDEETRALNESLNSLRKMAGLSR